MRKPWDQLSPKYRASLRRKGITAKQHASGKPLPGTKKHNARTQTKYTKTRASWDDFVNQHYATLSDQQKQEIDAALRRARPDRAVVWMDYQRRMTEMYDRDPERAARMYRNRPKDMPKELSIYHGAYS